MQRFKRIILPMQGHNKSSLHWLYNIKSDYEPPLIFEYEQLQFSFSGTGYRTSGKLLMYVSIPCSLLGIDGAKGNVATQTYLLKLFEPLINNLSNSYQNTDKNAREKAQFEVQSAGCTIARRNGITYNAYDNAFILRINFNVPLINALSVNAKSTIRAVKDIMSTINKTLAGFDRTELEQYIETYFHQQEIRNYMKGHGLCAFIANGSILPRENGTEQPMKGAIPFKSAEELLVKIVLSDGSVIEGMGIPPGVTVITGGGYSGKSTLLDAIEMGIYDHIPGDGREFVLSDKTALKTDAEDGRPVSNLDLSPFFSYLPCKDLKDFSTLHASICAP